jgi:hypothetical protein
LDGNEMTNRIQLRRSNVTGEIPTLVATLTGELLANITDNRLFLNNSTEVIQINAAKNIETDSSNRFVTDAQISSWTVGYTLPVATTSILGGVKIGTNINVALDGTISLYTADGTDAGLLSAADYATFSGKQAALGFTPVNKSGDTMTGSLTLTGDPTTTNMASNKGYVDSGLSGKLALAGGTMTGAITLAADPVAAMQPATMQYVTAQVSLVSGAMAAPVQALTDLEALTVDDIADKQMRLVEDVGAIFRFDVQSTDTVDGVNVLELTSAPTAGRWIKIQAATQNHESLSGLQGGATNDHTHLTAAEKTAYDAHVVDYALHLTSDQNTFIDAITATATEVNYSVGVTSDIQSQLNGKQASLGFTALNKAGDTMTGALILSGDPTEALNPVTLQYLQDLVIDCGTY